MSNFSNLETFTFQPYFITKAYYKRWKFQGPLRKSLNFVPMFQILSMDFCGDMTCLPQVHALHIIKFYFFFLKMKSIIP